MSKPLSITGEDRYNLMLSLIGFLKQRGTVPISEAAAAFQIDEKLLRKMVTSINDARAEVHGFEEWFFYVDIDELQENDNLTLVTNLVIDESPRLSARQASAIAAGLSYLGTIPFLKADPDLEVLQKMLSSESNQSANPVIEVRSGKPEAHSELIRAAIVDESQISCEYINQKGERMVRTIEPLRLDPRGDGWYLRGYCPVNQSLRNFKLDRMRDVTVLEAKITQAAKRVHDIEDGLYLADETDTTVVVEVQPEAYQLISEFRTVGEPSNVASGKIRAEIKVGHLPNIGRLIAKYGGAARVISPPEAKAMVRNYALEALGNLPIHPVRKNESKGSVSEGEG